jgi:nucleoside phosphorylase
MLLNAYAISSDEEFDAVVLAPTWTPMRVNGFAGAKIIDCKAAAAEKAGKNAQNSGRQPMMKKKSESYIIEWENLRIAWLKTGTCAGNVMDTVLFLSNLKTDRLIFVGAAGGVKPEVPLSEVLTPDVCYDYLGATRYLQERLDGSGFGSEVLPGNPRFISRILDMAQQQETGLVSRPVFCTDTIMGEYIHMEQIRQTGASVVEMETAAFYRAAALTEKAAVAFLVISDNSSNGGSLSAPKTEDYEHYNRTIADRIPKLIRIACQVDHG